MDPTGNASSTRATMTANAAMSATVRSIHAETQQQVEAGLRAKTSGTARNATGCIQKRPLNV